MDIQLFTSGCHIILKKTGICVRCNKNTNIDPNKKNRKMPRTQWSNISGKYLRDRSDYEEVCLKCHTQIHNDVKHDPMSWMTR